ncbi:MAG: hypothetical protein KBB77_01815 [Candidatus Moranbacteria bacterium]|nr:hypothetical protein [Candidatus Moranbacteria bacterium]
MSHAQHLEVLYVLLFVAIIIGVSAYWHSRTNRRALLAHLQGMENRANRLINPEHPDYPG